MPRIVRQNGLWADHFYLKINEERHAAGKGTVGFINPVLYANPDVLNDITNGTNLGCGSNGFQAVEGYVLFLCNPLLRLAHEPSLTFSACIDGTPSLDWARQTTPR
jgi:hypothetical protein